MTRPSRDANYRTFARRLLDAIDPSFGLIWTGYPKGYTWDGQMLNTSEVDPEMAIHDVAHVMVCPNRRRRLPEFGLGPDPSNMCPDDLPTAPCVVSYAYAQREEARACTVHWALAAYAGGAQDAFRVEGYVCMPTPPPRSLQALRRDFPYLPDDFVSRALGVRDEVLQRLRER